MARERPPQARPVGGANDELFEAPLAHLPGVLYRGLPGVPRVMNYMAGACQALTGCTAEQLTGVGDLKYDARIHPEDRAAAGRVIDTALLVRQRYALRYRIRTLDGCERWVYEQGAGVFSPAGELVAIEGFIGPLDESPWAPIVGTPERAERALLDSERGFAKVFQASPLALTISELETGLYLEANRGFERLFGWTQAEVLGRTAVELGVWRNSADRDAMVAAVRASGSLRDFDVVLHTRRGEPLEGRTSAELIELNGKQCLLATFEDETERRLAARALRKSEEKFAKAFHASMQSLIISELETGRFLDVNEGFERIFGYRREEVIGRTGAELGLWPDPAVRAGIVATMREHGSIPVREVVFPVKGGREVTVQIGLKTIEIDGVPCVLAAAIDVTAERQAAKRQQQLEAQLWRAQKLDALGQLAGGIAHDFNNLLTGIIGNTDLASLELEPTSSVFGYLEDARAACDRAQELVRRMLTFSRYHTQERAPIKLGPVVHEAVTLLRASLSSAVEIVEDLRNDAPMVLADATQIHQIVMNLGINAAHAMQRSSARLTVTVDDLRIDDGSGSERRLLEAGRYARLTVSDTGCGIEEATLAHVFDPFFTTKAPGEGTGLGLSVVHGIVEAHDGLITVSSVVGEGATFEIFLPEHDEPGVKPELPAGSTPSGRGEHILVVDDEAAVATVERALLERLGYRVTHYTDPEQAWHAFETEEFDLVLSDLSMPTLTGAELARRILAAKPSQPVLLATGCGGTWTSEGAQALGVRALISKPLTMAKLAEAVHGALQAPARD